MSLVNPLSMIVPSFSSSGRRAVVGLSDRPEFPPFAVPAAFPRLFRVDRDGAVGAAARTGPPGGEDHSQLPGPRLGLADISGIKAAAWAKQLRDQGYCQVTVTSVMKLLSLLLSDAVDERLIPVNPIRARHRGRRRSDRRVERLWATPS